MRYIYLFLTLLFISSTAAASWLHNTKIVRVSSFQGSTFHYVWLEDNHPECTASSWGNQVVGFEESVSGGKAILSTALTAYATQSLVAIDIRDCAIFEIYIQKF